MFERAVSLRGGAAAALIALGSAACGPGSSPTLDVVATDAPASDITTTPDGTSPDAAVTDGALPDAVATDSTPSDAPPVNTSILPADRATAWVPGMMARGGVPARTTVCATLRAADYGDGAREASGAIQSAIDACPAGQVVALSAGTFTVNDAYLAITRGITLRGAGAGRTILRKTNGAMPGSETAADTQPVIIVGPNRWPRPDDTTSQNLTADGAHGSFSVTVADASGFAPGQFVLLDELTGWSWAPLPATSGGPNAYRIRAGDRAVWQVHNPARDDIDDPLPDALSWFCREDRPINEIKEVASVSGHTVTFTTPLHISYRASHSAQLTRYTGDNVHVMGAGIEDLTVRGGGDGNIRFEAAAYSWMRGVEDTVWLGEGVALDHSFRIEVRDSYVHHGAWPQPGGGGYAISFALGTAEVLVENNIVMEANKMMVARSSGAGSVVAYNYTDDGHILTDPSWQEVGINGSHMVGSHHMLFEGNESFNYDSDCTHGNAIYHTVFRNHLTGVRRDYTGMANARAAGLEYGSWWHSFVGNVLGTPGMSGWTYEDPGMSAPATPGVGTYAWGDGFYIWKLGYDPAQWFDPAVQYPDPQVLATTLRHGNYDYVTNMVHWDPAITDHALPASLYLTRRPAFFDAGRGYVWPWVDPAGSPQVRTLPARARFDASTPFQQP